MATPLTYVDTPPRKPRSNTSLDVIPVHDVSAEHFVGIQFQTDPCSFPNPLPQNCYVTLGPVSSTAKTFGDPSNSIVTKVFGAYQGIECFLNGGLDDFRAVAQRVLENGEYRIVDGQIAALLASTAVATTPATAVTMAQALGLLESVLAAQVPGQGYIYMGPLAASIAVEHNLVIRNLDGTLETFLGTPIVIISEPSMALTIYASGPINLWRTPVDVVDAPAWTLNMGRALAERLYSLAIECGAWKVTAPAPATQSGEPPVEPGTPLTMTLGSIPSSPIPDGTDVTAVVQTNQPITEDIELWYSLNGGPDVLAGTATQVDTLEWVFNADESITGPGDSVEVWAKTMFDGNPVESNHITIEVT